MVEEGRGTLVLTEPGRSPPFFGGSIGEGTWGGNMVRVMIPTTQGDEEAGDWQVELSDGRWC